MFNFFYSHSLPSPLQLGLPLTITLKLFLSRMPMAFMLSNAIIPIPHLLGPTSIWRSWCCLPLWISLSLACRTSYSFFSPFSWITPSLSFLLICSHHPNQNPFIFNAFNFRIDYIVNFVADMLFWFYLLTYNLINFYSLSIYQLTNGGAAEICYVVTGSHFGIARFNLQK